MRSALKATILSLLVLVLFAGTSQAFQRTASLTDQEIIERLTKLEAGQEAIRREMKVRFDAIGQQLKSMDKRFELIDKRFESLDKRFDQFISLFGMIIGAFAAIVAVTIGFAIWDRRSMIRPFETRVQKMDAQILANRKQISTLLDALRELAPQDKPLADVLRSFSLL